MHGVNLEEGSPKTVVDCPIDRGSSTPALSLGTRDISNCSAIPIHDVKIACVAVR